MDGTLYPSTKSLTGPLGIYTIFIGGGLINQKEMTTYK